MPKAKSSLRFLIINIVALALLGRNVEAQTNPDSTLTISEDSLSIKIGQMIMMGVGEFNTADTESPIYEFIAQGKIGGVVLYEKNVNATASFNTLKSINERLQQTAKIPLFISIDEEGGKVNRLKTKYGFTPTRKASDLGAQNSLDSTYYYASLTSGLLDSLGINLNYAPDVDVNVNAENPVIARLGRSYSPNPYIVANHARAVIEAHRSDSVGTVIKHFPGHGSSTTDTHKDITDVSDYWMFYELIPFKALIDSGRVDAIMTAHIINARLDSAKLPATLSKSIIKGILREFMGYTGVVISDDMQMHAISKHYGLENAIVLSINAGVDILMFANNVPQTQRRTADEIHSIIINKIKEGSIPMARIEESYDRIMALKQQLGMLKTPLIGEEEKEGSQ